MRRLAAASLLTALLAQAGHAQAQDKAATIEAAANALGMVRGVTRRMTSINTVQFSGQGTLTVPDADGDWMTYHVTGTTVGVSYAIPAMRWDMTRIGADGEQRLIRVVRGDRSWNERLPGVDPTPAPDGATNRLRQLWLTPHGVIRAAVDNPDATTLGMQAGQTTLSVDVDGYSFTATLDDNYRPMSVETTIDHPVLGETQLEAAYTDYIDWPKLDVFFPSRIVHQLGGETTLDLTVTEFYQNPYVVFPTPEQLSGSSQ
ncbi:MAG: hypothetical protein ACR2QQ_04300 [Gammaproteobacteria bacterium]